MKLMIIAGEVSGDMHAGRLLAALRERYPNLEAAGIGGDQMIAQGLDAKYHIREMAFLGLTEVIRHLPFIRRVFREMLALARSFSPDAVILVDYPGFNLRLARKLKRLGLPVIYYISPQLWAWGRGRIKKIKKYVDRMLVIFPFEEEFYRQHGVDAVYVGHPLVDNYHDLVTSKAWDQANRVLGLLPGSRKQELENLLPDMAGAAEILFKEGIIKKVLLARVANIEIEYYRRLLSGFDFIELYEGPMHSYYNQLDVALVSSGTATLEAAYFRVPSVIVYRVGWLTWQLGNMLVKLDMIGLANIVAGKEIADELLQNDFSAGSAASLLSLYLVDHENIQRREELKIIAEKLGAPGASRRAADEVIRFVTGEINPDH